MVIVLKHFRYMRNGVSCWVLIKVRLTLWEQTSLFYWGVLSFSRLYFNLFHTKSYLLQPRAVRTLIFSHNPVIMSVALFQIPSHNHKIPSEITPLRFKGLGKLYACGYGLCSFSGKGRPIPLVSFICRTIQLSQFLQGFLVALWPFLAPCKCGVSFGCHSLLGMTLESGEENVIQTLATWCLCCSTVLHLYPFKIAFICIHI